MLMLGALMLIGCQSEEQDIRHKADGLILHLDVSLGLQPDGDMEVTLAPGDPGTYENFEYPQYAYVYLVADNGTTQTICQRTNEAGDEPLPLSFSLNPDNWRQTGHTLSVPQTFGDNIYVYLDKLHFEIPSGTTEARLYVAMSKRELNNLTGIAVGDAETSLLSSTFNVISLSGTTEAYLFLAV